jgi:hypothetical protein
VIVVGLCVLFYGLMVGLIDFGSLRSWLMVRDQWAARGSQEGADSWRALTTLHRSNFFLVPLCILSGAIIIVATFALDLMK